MNSESQVEALDKEEDRAGGAGTKEPKEPQEKASSKKSFICKACDKSFHFYCRLKVHMKRCRVARGKQIQCKECTEVKATKNELEKHQLEVHGEVGWPRRGVSLWHVTSMAESLLMPQVGLVIAG